MLLLFDIIQHRQPWIPHQFTEWYPLLSAYVHIPYFCPTTGLFWSVFHEITRLSFEHYSVKARAFADFMPDCHLYAPELDTLDAGMVGDKQSCFRFSHIEGILSKGPYLPCVSMAGRALLAGYHRYNSWRNPKLHEIISFKFLCFSNI